MPRANKPPRHVILFVVVTLSKVQGARKASGDTMTCVRIYGAENYFNIIDGLMEDSVIESFAEHPVARSC